MLIYIYGWFDVNVVGLLHVLYMAELADVVARHGLQMYHYANDIVPKSPGHSP